MPVEIREINIKATITEGKKPNIRGRGAKDPSANKDQIVAECVEKVMELLKLNQER